MNLIRTVSIFLLVALALSPALIPHPLPPRNKSFSLEAISAQHPFNPEWEIRPLSHSEEEEIAKALSQPYHYLGSGGQCFSFVSSDDRYVIKFIKQKAFDIPIWMNHFPLPFLIYWLREKKLEKREAKRNRVFNAFKLSFDLLSEETGLFYVHLNRTQHLKKTLSFCDALGKTHFLNLDDLEFIVQKKADLAYNTLNSLMKKNDIERAKLAIEQLLTLNIKLYQKGFLNRDPNFRSNCGFIENGAIIIDVGRIIYSEKIKKPKKYKQELLKITPKFRFYISTQYPELIPYFDQVVEKIINSEPIAKPHASGKSMILALLARTCEELLKG